jgi:hypothetical protein
MSSVTTAKGTAMNLRRTAALATALCLGGIGLTACSGGIITPGPTRSPGPSSAPSSAPAAPLPGGGATPSVSVSNGKVTVGGSLGSFPIPPGAEVLENVANGHTIDLVLGSVTASRVSSFYASALPRAGYTVTSNTSASGKSFAGVSIKFTGHGYQGTIGAVSGVSIPGVSGLGGGDIVGVTLTAQ